MKLSEAIRLGAMLKPQGFGACLWDGRTCAMGAAYDAIGGLGVIDDGKGWGKALAVWPSLRIFLGRECHLCSDESPMPSEANVIAHMNDAHGWTREQIATWVQELEAQHEAKAEQPAAVTVRA